MASFSITLFDSSALMGDDIEVILLDATNDNITCTLQAIGDDGESYAFKRIDTSMNTVTLAAHSGDTIEGESSILISIETSFRIIAYGGDFKVFP